ncbi:SurA N-terminal domain-containing protein [Nocardioides sp. GY 10127]|uniref:SurA N-terminal domain-containing protein n=1 Tax=Nocardioides sp. GY 10127 TaxID=2569762 RepID=UPI0010A8D494|nr:SurA N-terminal domain-containing protein [Nocardioides sp. GY 10127]TIC81829.1 hypothetical protein E8D37_11680 [Nocardioides sp. GY 10127]
MPVLRSPFRALAVSATAVGLALSLTACGVSSASMQPGVAASVNGTDISVSDVDQTAISLCKVSVAVGSTTTALSGAYLRDIVVDALVRVQVVYDVAEENGLDADAMLEKELDAAQTQIDALDYDGDVTDGVVTLVAANNFFTDVLYKVAGTDTTDERVYLAQWQASHELDINPLYDDVDLAGTLTVREKRNDTSVAVSDTATEFLDSLRAEVSGSGDGSVASSLPNNQRCV